MKIKSLKVTAATTDISALVQGMTLYESINGLVKGTLQIFDGVNFFDEVIGYHDELVPIEIVFDYMDIPVTNIFMADGISNMKIEKSSKEYVIHLITPIEQTLKLTNILNVYRGTSEQIAYKIFKEASGEESRLILNTKAVTNGKYVVPNISAFKAIDNVVKHAVDADHTGFYFYQTITDLGATRLMSIKTMSKYYYKNPDGTKFAIKNARVNNCIMHDGTWFNDTVGTASQFKVEQYKMYNTDALIAGQYGNKINQVELDKTAVKKNNPVEYSKNEITTYKTSASLYDNYMDAAHGVPKRFIGLRQPPNDYWNRKYWEYPTDADRLWAINLKDEGFMDMAIKSSTSGIYSFRKHYKKAIKDFEAEIKRIEAGIPIIGSWNEKSLFDDDTDPVTLASINHKKRAYNTALSVKDMVPVPVLGCGMSVMVKQGGSNISHTISDGAYIVSDINHIFKNDGNKFDYIQNLSLIREYA